MTYNESSVTWIRRESMRSKRLVIGTGQRHSSWLY